MKGGEKMEMQTKNEIPNNIPFPILKGPTANPSEKTRKQGATREQQERGKTDFSSKLASVLDQAANHQISNNKARGNRKPDELKQTENDGRDTSLPMAIVPGVQENANLLLDLGTGLLTGLKDFAVQSVAAAVIPQVPLLLAVTSQFLNPKPATPEQTLTGPSVKMMDALKAPIAAGEFVVPEGFSIPQANELVSSSDGVPTQVFANPAVITQATTPLTETNKPLTNSPALVSTAANASGTVTDSITVPIPDPLAALTQANASRPATKVILTPNLNSDALVSQASNPVPSSTLQTLIQQDLVSAQINLNPAGNPIHLKTATTPAANTAKDDSDDSAPVTLLNEENIPVVVASTEQKDLPGQLLAKSKTDQKPALSDKQDASAMAPVLFDKVMASTNEIPVTTPPPVQPRQDLHEVVKQVMEGMISPTQQLKSSQVIITLKPEHLGEVTMKINVDGDKVTASFHAASSEVRAILESSLPQLRQEMSQQGWQFDSNGVFGGMQEFMANQGQQQTRQQQMVDNIQRGHRAKYDDAVAFTHNGRLQVMSAAAVDYRI